MHCPDCRAAYTEGDTYCRHCGADLTEVSQSTSLVPSSTMLPSVLQRPQLQRTVAAGVGALALGIGIELLRRGLLARLTRSSTPAMGSVLPMLSGMKDMLPAQHREKLPKRVKGGYEVQEFVYMRRIMRR